MKTRLQQNHHYTNLKELKQITLSDTAFLSIGISSHALPFLGFFSDLQARGLSFDAYGPQLILKGVLGGTVAPNHFDFPELDLSMREGNLEDVLKCTYNGLLKTAPGIEAIWEKHQKKPKLIMADMCAIYAKYLTNKHGIPLFVLRSTYIIEHLKEPPHTEDLIKTMLLERSESLAPLDKEVEEKCQVIVKSIKMS